MVLNPSSETLFSRLDNSKQEKHLRKDSSNQRSMRNADVMLLTNTSLGGKIYIQPESIACTTLGGTSKKRCSQVIRRLELCIKQFV